MELLACAATIPCPQEAPIMTLPNELLREILSNVLAQPEHPTCRGELPTNLFDDDARPDPTPALTIRSVCHRFRAIANELPFWYDGDFDLLKLLPEYRGPNSDIQDEKFLQALFTDDHLVECLRRKTQWKFRHLPSLYVVMERVPSFQQFVTAVTLRTFWDDSVKNPLLTSSLDVAIQQLATCSRLTSLKIEYSDSLLSLDLISRYCPSLSDVIIHADASTVRGTLENLSCVRRLDYEFVPYAEHPAHFLFPLNSAKSLTTLMIRVRPSSADAYDTTGLDVFVNLTSLHIDPLYPSVCDFILRSRLKLTTFKTIVDTAEVTMRRVAAVLSSPSLQTVQNISLKIETENEERLNDLQQIIYVVTTKLLSIRDCEFEMGLDLRWCQQFSRLLSLKTVVWKVRFVDKAFRCLNSELDEAWLDKEEYAEMAFSAAFAKFPEKPHVQIELVYSQDYWDDVAAAEEEMYEALEAEMYEDELYADEQRQYEEYLSDEEFFGAE